MFIIREIFVKIQKKFITWFEVCRETGLKRKRIGKVVAIVKTKEEALWLKNQLNRMNPKNADKLIRLLVSTTKIQQSVEKMRIRAVSFDLMPFLPQSTSFH